MAWNFHAPTRAIELGWWLASMLRDMDGADYPQLIPRYYPSASRPSDQYFAREATLESPRVLKCDLVQGTLILLQGVKRADTALKLLNAYGEVPNLRIMGGANSQVNRAVDEIITAMGLNGTTLAHNLLIAGHSFGGAVAQGLGAWFKEQYPTKDIRVVSFGSPRVGPPPWVQYSRNLDHARYWSELDPIVFVPPHRGEAYNGHVFLTRNVSSRWDSMAQTGLGIMLRPFTNAVLRDYPAAAPEYTELNLVGWATGLLSPPVETHSIREYFVRINTSHQAGVTFQPAPSGAPHRPTEAPPTSPPIPTAPPPAVVAAVAAVETARTTLRTVPNPHTFQAQHLFGQWGVYRGEECITMCGTRNAARRLANQGNQMLRQATARGVNNDAEIARVLAGML